MPNILFKEKKNYFFLLHLTNLSLILLSSTQPFFSIFFLFIEFCSWPLLPLVLWPLFSQLKSTHFLWDFLPMCKTYWQWPVRRLRDDLSDWSNRQDKQVIVEWNYIRECFRKNEKSSDLTDRHWEAILCILKQEKV